MELRKLSGDELSTTMRHLKDWKLSNNGIEKEFVFPTFPDAFAFMTAVAFIAEKLNHHPEWSGDGSRVYIRLSTHDVGGVSSNDIKMAELIELNRQSL